VTYREALTRATDQLSMHPELRPTALPDAALLLMHALHIERPTLIAHPDRKIDRDQQAQYQRLIERRLNFEPIQYITGEQEFYGLTLRVTPAVLIPRPETELLVEAVLNHLNSVPHSSESHPHEWGHPQPRILDVGTGSGAIAIALAHHLPQAQITAVDLSPQALVIARENAQTHNLTNIDFRLSDLLEALASPLEQRSEATRSLQDPAKWDVIVSNPPYIPAAELLHPQVHAHEPHTALFAGPTGLDIYARLIPQAHAALKPDGLLALEIGHGQKEDIAALLAQWKEVEFLNDLQGIPRITLALKR
jgi:release factor glutamine methyltransferase